MFHSIEDRITARMRELEALDAQDRANNTPKLERLRQIPADTGKFLALQAALAPDGAFLEIGTSAGYSAMWISLATIARGVRLQTFEILEAKARLARETLAKTGLDAHIDFVHEDARERLAGIADVAFCFLDAEKEVYTDCFRLLLPNLKPGGIILADNMTSHSKELAGFLQLVEQEPTLDAVVVPIGNGVLLCRRA